MTTILDHLQTISRDLDYAITELKTLELAAAEAESAYRVAKATAFMKAEGPVQAREHQAVIDTPGPADRTGQDCGDGSGADPVHQVAARTDRRRPHCRQRRASPCRGVDMSIYSKIAKTRSSHSRLIQKD